MKSRKDAFSSVPSPGGLHPRDTGLISDKAQDVCAQPPLPSSDTLLRDVQAQLQTLSEAIDAFHLEGRAVRDALDDARSGRPDVQITPEPADPADASRTPISRYAASLPDLLTPDPDPYFSLYGEQSMDLGTPLQPTVLLDPHTLRRTHSPGGAVPLPSLRAAGGTTSNVNPEDVPLPPSPSPPPTTPSPPSIWISPSSPPTRVPTPPPLPPPPATPQLFEKIDALESKLAGAQTEIAERDAQLEELRLVVDRLRGELSVVRGPVILAEPEAGSSHSSGNAEEQVDDRWDERFEEDDAGA